MSRKAEEGRLRVMIVDDEEDIRILLNTIFRVNGFDVVCLAENGDEAVPAALETQPDVIVLDYMMPRIDGGETALFLRAVAPRARIIAFSGVITELPDWADEFIQKGGVAEITEFARRVMDKEPKPAPKLEDLQPVGALKGIRWT